MVLSSFDAYHNHYITVLCTPIAMPNNTSHNILNNLTSVSPRQHRYRYPFSVRAEWFDPFLPSVVPKVLCSLVSTICISFCASDSFRTLGKSRLDTAVFGGFVAYCCGCVGVGTWVYRHVGCEHV